MLEQLLNPKILAGVLLAIGAVYYVVQEFRDHLEIQRLGGYAPKVRSWLPLGRLSLLIYPKPLV